VIFEGCYEEIDCGPNRGSKEHSSRRPNSRAFSTLRKGRLGLRFKGDLVFRAGNRVYWLDGSRSPRSQTTAVDIPWPIRFNKDRTANVSREKPMKKLVFAILLISSPAWAQTKLVPKSATARVDNCAPIGRTADRQLVYSMKCDNLPAPPPPPPQAEVAPPPEPEVQRSGLFGMSLLLSGSSTPPAAAPAGQ
jgi:hypothetical protein